MKYNRYLYLIGVISAISICFLSGCSGKGQPEDFTNPILETGQIIAETSAITEYSTENNIEKDPITDTANTEPESAEPTFISTDWSDYFGRLNGSAVVYDAAQNQYFIYNQELAEEQRSPCSTFKIISSLIGLEHGIIVPGNSVHTWSGERFWNEAWNKDIGFEDAFRTSCVWYYREVIDEIGQETIQDELERLQYGNMDSSDWEGRLNNNNNNRALTGFWIESSLKISPIEQVQVMERIFGTDTVYQSQSVEALKQVMLLTDYETENRIYGKTGMGKLSGAVVDSWFTGFSDTGEEKIYFCVHLGETEGEEVSSTKAKEIAVRIIEDNFSS